MTTKTKHTVAWIISLFLIFIFVFTAISQLRDQHTFEILLRYSPVLKYASEPLSRLVPIVSLGIATLLLIPSTNRLGLLVSCLFMIAVTIYIAAMLLNKDRPCSCTAVLSKLTWMQHLLFNVLFLLLSGLAYRWANKDKFFIRINRHSRKPV